MADKFSYVSDSCKSRRCVARGDGVTRKLVIAALTSMANYRAQYDLINGPTRTILMLLYRYTPR